MSNLQLPTFSPIIRGFGKLLQFRITMDNIDSEQNILAVQSPRTNFNISIFFAEHEETDRSKRSTYTMVGPFYASMKESDIAQGVAANDAVTYDGSVQIVIPRQSCPDLHFICSDVMPGDGATYQLASGDEHFNCTSVTGILNCIGN